MNFELKSFRSDTELASAAASQLIDLVRSKTPLTVALSGGRIAKTFFDEIVTQVRNQRIEFNNVDFFWADERCVPPTDPESNFYLADQHLFQPLKIGAQRIHRLKGELAPEIAVQQAAAELSGPLDLVILGMGEDGHVASMFPNTADAITQSTATFVHIENSPKPPPNRLSLSYAALAIAKQLWVLASGNGKEIALKKSLLPHDTTPLARVLNHRSATTIFTDIQL